MHWSVYQSPRLRPKHRLWLVVATLVVLLASLALFNGLLGGQVKLSAPVSRPNQPATSQGQPPAKRVEGRYLLNGTVTWARGIEQQAAGDYSQPFRLLDSFSRQNYDAWSADFECPITDNSVSYQTEVAQLVFNCRPEFLPAAVKYFNIFDLANNHTDNQGGEVGLDETRQRLDAAGAQYFGTFDPADSDNVCEVLSLPVRIIRADKSQQTAALPVAFCGWHYFYRQPNAGEISVMDKYAKIMPVFAFAEMGAEYHAQADAIQASIAHQIIDHGPEFLIANNPHWVQNTEVYKGKLIVYSTGNFIFDQVDNETERSASIDVTASVDYNDNVGKWLELGPSCQAFHDDCLARAQKLELSKVQLKLKYDVVAGQNGYKLQAHKADAATQAAVEQRLNWAQTLQQLGQP